MYLIRTKLFGWSDEYMQEQISAAFNEGVAAGREIGQQEKEKEIRSLEERIERLKDCAAERRSRLSELDKKVMELADYAATQRKVAVAMESKVVRLERESDLLRKERDETSKILQERMRIIRAVCNGEWDEKVRPAQFGEWDEDED